LTFGRLKFVASSDIGDLGPSRGLEAFYNWRWYHNIPSLALWLILIVAMIVIKANHTIRILFIFMPLLILSVLWFLITKMMNFRSYADVETFNMMFNSLVAGITLLWLFAPKLGRLNPWISFFLSLALTITLVLVGIVSYHGLGFSQDTVVALVMLAVLAMAMLLGFILAGWCCRKYYGLVMLWLALWMVVICLACTLAFFLIAFMIEQAPIPISTILLMGTIVGLVLGVCLYVINLPYMILALCNSFFRERFRSCLGLKPIPAAPQQVHTGLINEQNPGTEMSDKGDSA